MPPDTEGTAAVVDPAELELRVRAELDRLVRARMQSRYGDAGIEAISDEGAVLLRFDRRRGGVWRSAR